MTYSLISKPIFPSRLLFFIPIIYTELHKPLVSPRFLIYPNSFCIIIPFSVHTLTELAALSCHHNHRNQKERKEGGFFARIHSLQQILHGLFPSKLLMTTMLHWTPTINWEPWAGAPGNQFWPIKFIAWTLEVFVTWTRWKTLGSPEYLTSK